MPLCWRMPADETSTLCNVRWWEQLNDPVLDELIFTALRNNQDIKLAIARVMEYYARLGIVNSQLLPNINGSAAYNRVGFSTAYPNMIPATLTTTNVYTAYLNLNWILDIWGQLHNESAAACDEFLAQVEIRRGIVLTVVSNVASAYITLRGLDAQLVISRDTVKSRQESLQLARDRFEIGETSEIEVVQAEAELEIALIRSIEYERDIPIQENLISALIGEMPQCIERGLNIGAFPYPCTVPTGLPSELLRRRPDIAAAEEALKATNARIAVAIANFFPQLTLTSQIGSQSVTLSQFLTGPAQTWQWGIAALQPIFDAGLNYWKLKAAEELYQATLHRYVETVLQALREVNDALVAYAKDRELVDEHARQVDILKVYLHLATLRYNEGEVDYLNVLDAERSLFDAQLQYAQSQADSLNALVSLYAALGGGWVDEADSLAVTNEFCD